MWLLIFGVELGGGSGCYRVQVLILPGVQLPGGHMYTSQDGIVYVLMSRSDIQCIDYLFFPESAFFNMHQLTKRVCVEGISMATSQQQKALTAFLGGFWFAMP